MIPKKFTSHDTLPTQVLPFVVRMASHSDLEEVAALRSSAYGKHIPALGIKLREPEESDYELGCEVMVARSKLDGSLLGTLRTHTNVFKPLPLQASIRLPAQYQGARMVEATRLCVTGNPNSSLVRSALFKALFQYCVAQGIEWMLAAGRRPVDRIYDALLFSDVGEPGKFWPMTHAGGVLHRVMSLSPDEALVTWKACEHPLYQFVIETKHPDIDVSMFAAMNFPWACPEEDSDFESAPAPLSGFGPMSRYDYLSNSAEMKLDTLANSADGFNA
ncbi:MAG: hypothetical protein KBF40_13325 [Giesbergeria sp.]|nr:hypothetical protein [Rhodoferax sp.]MBP9896307.1 hypothetical protein [Giesbergeria sp.]